VKSNPDRLTGMYIVARVLDDSEFRPCIVQGSKVSVDSFERVCDSNQHALASGGDTFGIGTPMIKTVPNVCLELRGLLAKI